MQFPSFELLGQSLLSGLFIGGLYGLLGLGLSLSWGMLKQINLAHFALSFFGAYLTYQLSVSFGLDPLVTLVIKSFIEWRHEQELKAAADTPPERPATAVPTI